VFKYAHHIFVCINQRPAGHPKGDCASKGSRDVFKKFQEETEKRQLWETVTVSGSTCLGPCALGANVVIYPEGGSRSSGCCCRISCRRGPSSRLPGTHSDGCPARRVGAGPSAGTHPPDGYPARLGARCGVQEVRLTWLRVPIRPGWVTPPCIWTFVSSLLNVSLLPSLRIAASVIGHWQLGCGHSRCGVVACELECPLHWGIVQRQDSRLWIWLSRFES
jgi:hypothetical protein